jgi:hypothetical protein
MHGFDPDPRLQFLYNLEQADITYGRGSNIQLPEKDDTTVKGRPSEGKPISCEGRFVPFPSE